MKKTIIALTVLVFFAAGLVPAFSSAECGKKCPAKPAAHKKGVSSACPVMGTKIPDVSKSKGGKSVYKGKTYHFCCPGCKPQFDKDPKKYIKKTPAKKMPAKKK